MHSIGSSIPRSWPRIKRETNDIEDRFREQGLRKVNLDPGLLSLPRFVLATTKDNAHRIPLEGGIYAEITLLFGKGTFRPLPWTYPDFRSENYIEDPERHTGPLQGPDSGRLKRREKWRVFPL